MCVAEEAQHCHVPPQEPPALSTARSWPAWQPMDDTLCHRCGLLRQQQHLEFIFMGSEMPSGLFGQAGAYQDGDGNWWRSVCRWGCPPPPPPVEPPPGYPGSASWWAWLRHLRRLDMWRELMIRIVLGMRLSPMRAWPLGMPRPELRRAIRRWLHRQYVQQ